MQPLILLLGLALLLLAFVRTGLRLEAPSPRPAPPEIRVKAAPASAPATAPVRFEVPAPVAAPQDSVKRARLRDRYIAARFPGLASSSASLANTGDVITSARLLFEEDRYVDVQEFLQLAIAQAPAPEVLELVRLEITFLHRDANRYVILARQFRDAHPNSREWGEVARLGRALAPQEPLFAGDHPDPQLHEHYGPWPHTPNWIRASWDLTPDVLAAEFHHAMRQDRENEKGVVA